MYYTLTWRIKMIIFIKLILIGIISGIILAGVMRAFRLMTGSKADILLYNMDYMPFLKKWSDYWITGILFHYATCIASAVILFYLLVPFTREMTVCRTYWFLQQAGAYFISLVHSQRHRLTGMMPPHGSTGHSATACSALRSVCWSDSGSRE